jgi:hypothetical protein
MSARRETQEKRTMKKNTYEGKKVWNVKFGDGGYVYDNASYIGTFDEVIAKAKAHPSYKESGGIQQISLEEVLDG